MPEFTHLRKKGVSGIAALYVYNEHLAGRPDMVPITKEQFEDFRDGKTRSEDLDFSVEESAEHVSQRDNALAQSRAKRIMDSGETPAGELGGVEPAQPDAAGEPGSGESIDYSDMSDDEWCESHNLPGSESGIHHATRKKEIRAFGLNGGASVPGNWSVDEIIAAIRGHLGQA